MTERYKFPGSITCAATLRFLVFKWLYNELTMFNNQSSGAYSKISFQPFSEKIMMTLNQFSYVHGTMPQRQKFNIKSQTWRKNIRLRNYDSIPSNWIEEKNQCDYSKIVSLRRCRCPQRKLKYVISRWNLNDFPKNKRRIEYVVRISDILYSFDVGIDKLSVFPTLSCRQLTRQKMRKCSKLLTEWSMQLVEEFCWHKFVVSPTCCWCLCEKHKTNRGFHCMRWERNWLHFINRACSIEEHCFANEWRASFTTTTSQIVWLNFSDFITHFILSDLLCHHSGVWWSYYKHSRMTISIYQR